MNRTAIGISDQIDSRSADESKRAIEANDKTMPRGPCFTSWHSANIFFSSINLFLFRHLSPPRPLPPTPLDLVALSLSFDLERTRNRDQLNFFRFVYSPFRNNLNANGSNRWRNFRLNGFSLPSLRNGTIIIVRIFLLHVMYLIDTRKIRTILQHVSSIDRLFNSFVNSIHISKLV